MHYKALLSCLAILALGACSQVQLASHVVKKSMPQNALTSKSQGTFKVGSPYKIAGKRYKPKETYNFSQTGIASWYGPNFDGKPTANGEIFDMTELTAAHNTLQMPSLVRVTNLENGRSLIVRVNDRGPFKRGRIIDLSKRSAELLGFKNKGIAKVKIQVLGPESRAIAEIAKRGESTRGIEVAMNEDRKKALKQLPKPVPPIQNASLQSVESETLAAPQIPGHLKQGNFLPDPVVEQLPVGPSNIYVQAGSFGNEANAARLARSLGTYGQSNVYPAVINGKKFYRVRLGPMGSVGEADTVLSRLGAAGRDQAVIIVD